jgi:hypothetical protein
MLNHLTVKSCEVFHPLGQRPHERSDGINLFRYEISVLPNKSVQPTTAGLWLCFRFPLAFHFVSLPPSRLTCGFALLFHA